MLYKKVVTISTFGGFIRANYSRFRQNGPALTRDLRNISVDFTVAYRIPLHKTLTVVKYYEDHLLHVTRPSLVDYYKQVTEPVKDYICRIVDENGDRLEVYSKYLRDLKSYLK